MASIATTSIAKTCIAKAFRPRVLDMYKLYQKKALEFSKAFYKIKLTQQLF